MIKSWDYSFSLLPRYLSVWKTWKTYERIMITCKTKSNEKTYWAMKYTGILQLWAIHHQEIKRHNAWRNPIVLCISCLRVYNMRITEEISRDFLHPESNPSKQTRGGIYRGFIQKYLRYWVIWEENISYTCTRRVDEKLLQV